MRLLRLGGTRNLRDLGGYATRDGRRTRWRTVYRSDCLDRIDAEGQVWLVRSGLRTIIDLRDSLEATIHPNVFAKSTQIAHRRLPLWDEAPPANVGPQIADGYIRPLGHAGQQLARIVEAVAAPGALPVLIHCAAGKDRTGIVVALLLAAIGVSNETIAEDYALSIACLGPEYVTERRQWVHERGLDWERWAHVFDTPPERMLKTLEYLERRFGGAEAYLVRHGVSAECIAVLRHQLTEPNTGPVI